MGNLRSKFGKNRSTNYVTFLSTDAGRTDGRLRDFIVCPMHMHSIALDRQKLFLDDTANVALCEHGLNVLIAGIRCNFFPNWLRARMCTALRVASHVDYRLVCRLSRVDLSTSHSVSMLETVRSASLCQKLATSCRTVDADKKSSLRRRTGDHALDQQTNGQL